MLDYPRWKLVLVLLTTGLFCWFSLPNFVPSLKREDAPAWLPHRSLNLGLDLQGGSHLLLQLDVESYEREQMTNLLEDVRMALRREKIAASGLASHNNHVTLRSDVEEDTLRSAILPIRTGLEIIREEDGYRISLTDSEMSDIREKLMQQSLEIINRRINETGTREPIIQRQGESRILVQVPGLQDPERLKQILGKTAKMTFHLVDNSVSPDEIMTGRAPIGTRILQGDSKDDVYSDGTPVRYAIKSRVMLSGDSLTSASATFEQGQPVVAFKFDSAGAQKFARITTDNVGKPFAIVLDNKVITAPRINEPIVTGSGIISGRFTVQSANDLALLLRAGALPAPLDIIEERTVGPSLGADSIEAGRMAAIIAMALVAGFMLISYGLFGVFANIALLFNVLMIIGALSLFQATLTLPGIAGIVLTFGMAVDANVLIFERIREELAMGKSPMASVDLGFKGAFSTILDANITTLIAAFLLFYFGSGTVKGFAVTLSIGILSSMFTAILLTRLFVVWWMRAKRPKLLPI
jgi:preprotein translocase subunit SecD